MRLDNPHLHWVNYIHSFFKTPSRRILTFKEANWYHWRIYDNHSQFNTRVSFNKRRFVATWLLNNPMQFKHQTLRFCVWMRAGVNKLEITVSAPVKLCCNFQAKTYLAQRLWSAHTSDLPNYQVNQVKPAC